MDIDYNALAKKYGTPLYIYDFDYIENRYTTLKEAFAGKKSLINYAVKANSNLSVIAHLAKMGAGADCVSIGEVRRALDAGVDKYKIIFSVWENVTTRYVKRWKKIFCSSILRVKRR
jgi:diaminopimelate decarboxylase